jgi:hypothetical protein
LGTVPAPNIPQDVLAASESGQNALAEYARVAALKQQTAQSAAMAPLQQQQAQQQIEAQRRQFADQDALTKAITQYDPDKHTLADIPKLITQNGGSGEAALKAQGGLVTQRQNLLKLSDEQFAQEQKKADLIAGVHDQVSQSPPEQKQQTYQQGLMTLGRAGVDVSKEPPQYPGDDVFAQHLPAIRLHSAIVAEADKDRELSTKEQEAKYKEVNGVLYDISGPQPKIIQPQGLDPKSWGAAVDQIVPDTGDNHALNMRTHSEVQFALQRGDMKSAQAALTAAGAQLGTIEKETNPQVQANKVATATAEGQARANIEAATARGSNAALAQVPPHLVAPASAAANKAGEDYAQAQSVSQRIQAMMEAAKKGNVVSYQLIPEEGALQVVTAQGIHRINMAEIQNYGGGSVFQRLEGHVGKALTGKSIPDSVLSDMADIQKLMADGSKLKYNNSIKTINQTYGAKFQPVEMEDMNTPKNDFFSQFGGKKR